MTMFVNPFFEVKRFLYWHRFILMETAQRAKLYAAYPAGIECGEAV